MPVFILIAFCVVFLGQMPKACANQEVWAVYEQRVRFTDIPSLQLRIGSESIFNLQTGLQASVLRTGPVLQVNRWLMLALHEALVLRQLPDKNYETAYRTEFDFHPFGTFFNLRWNYRFRQDFTFNNTFDTQYRMRHLVRLNYPLAQTHWIPFISEEVFVVPELAHPVTEVRNIFGVGWLFDNQKRIDVAYVLKNRYMEGWHVDHAVMLMFFFDAPAKNNIETGN